MINRLLLPRKCRIVGFVLFPFAAAWLIASYVADVPIFPLAYKPAKAQTGMFPPEFLLSRGFYADFNGELSLLLTLASLFLIAFARERHEDEYVNSVRLKALQVSVYANYIILALASILFYGFSYIYVMQINLFTILIIFIAVFHFNLHIRPRIAKSVSV